MIPKLLGVLNITPDSFYDGGRYEDGQSQWEHALQMLEDGADIIDVGAESSRPGAVKVSPDEELIRLKKFVSGCPDSSIFERYIFSIDSRNIATLQFALDSGFSMVNDISGGGTRGEHIQMAVKYSCPIILMHMQGKPETMQKNPQYDDPIRDIREFFIGKIKLAENFALPKEHLILDPGIGFGKRRQDNDAILRELDHFTELGHPILLGLSRKSFLKQNDEPQDRLAASIAALSLGYINGAKYFRVHDVPESRKALNILQRIMEVK